MPADPPPPPDDAELVRRAQAGDEAAFEALVVRHLPSLRAYLHLRMGPTVRRWETTSDLAQSVCGEVLRGIEHLDYRGDAEFKQWLFTTARRKIVERQRYLTADKRNVDRVMSNTGEAPADDLVAREICDALGGPSDIAEQREMVARVHAALDEMPELEREVILLTRLAGLTTKAVAERLERTESAVRNILARALGRLATKLG